MCLQQRLEPGETWEEVMQRERDKAAEYIGVQGGHPMPPQTVNALIDIAYNGRVGHGHFINAVMDNDLDEAIFRADRENSKALVNIVFWLNNPAPGRDMRKPHWPGFIKLNSMKRCRIRKDIGEDDIGIPIELTEAYLKDEKLRDSTGFFAFDPERGYFIEPFKTGCWLGFLNEEANEFNTTIIDAKTYELIGRVNSVDLEWME